jgi:D-serine deaminase-like pyridoxal phosphate-dependent protein
LKELEMVLGAGGPHAVMAYPLVQELKVERLCDLCDAHAESTVDAIASATLHFELLDRVSKARQQPLNVMVDVDSGMHRTGVAMGQATEDLYRKIDHAEFLRTAGLHWYDGHEHIADPVERERIAQGHVGELQVLKAGLERGGLAVPKIVAGNTWTFPYYARAEGMFGSPGTCTYWDTGYGDLLVDLPFKWAACVLTQVVEVYREHQVVTTDLGSKAIPADTPLEKRARILGHHDAVLRLQNEEHGVFDWPGQPPSVGSYLMAVPGHVCPTAIRYPGAFVVDGEGHVTDYFTHSARDRQ